jgi:HD-like signal output (HDOD) protein
MTRDSQADAPDRSSVHVRLLRLFASPTYRPPLLPRVALELMQVSQKASVGFDDVVGLLEQDPVLAAKVLSIAQSALYAPRSPILSLRQALVRLGLDTLRDLVVEAALTLRVFRVPGYGELMERLGRHSTVTAHLMRVVCVRTAIEAEYAFLCGLLHDVGIAACLLALSDDARGGVAPLSAIEPVLDTMHEEVSGLVSRLWGLAPELQRVVATHHLSDVSSRPHPVNAALVVAEHLAFGIDAGMAPAAAAGEPACVTGLDASRPGLLEAACDALSLDAAALERLRSEAAVLVMTVGRPGRSAVG